MNINLLSVIPLLLLFTACKTTEPYETADMDLPREYHSPDSISQDQDLPLPDSVSKNLEDTLIPWDEFFQDPVLVELINDVFKQNFDLRTANKEIAINEQYYKQSKAAFWPSLNLNLLNIEREWSSRNSSSSVEDDWYDHKGKEPPENMYVSTSEYSSSMALDWELDIWGKLRKKKRAEKAFYLQSFEARKAIQTAVVATVAEDYYNLLMLDEQILIAERNYSLRDSTLNMIKLQYDSGEASSLAVQQSRSQVLEAKALLPTLEKEQAMLENKLRLLVGKLPGNIKRGAKFTALDKTYAGVRDLPAHLVQNRPDVKIAEYELQAAHANAGTAMVARYPNLGISLTGGTSSVLASNWLDIPGSIFGSVVGGLTAPLFNNRELKTQYEVAKLERDEAEISFQQSVYQAIVDIEDATVSIDKLQERLDIAKEQREVAQNALIDSRRLYRSGYATYLEVITAQSEALDSELALVRAKANLLSARIQLYRALGGGWNYGDS